MNTDLRLFILLFHLAVAIPSFSQLKSIVYDFEGQDIGQVDLPEGDYRGYDMQASVSQNPLGSSEMLGDRVLKLKMNWSSGRARFGKGISRFIELNASADYFNLYIYNPTTNASSSKFDITITEDDNGNNVWEDSQDDRWKRSVLVDRSSSWQKISLPLSSFTDNNSGGNGIFDAKFTNPGGKIFNIEFNFYKNSVSETNSTVYIDMICFSERALPTGSSILTRPAGSASDYCLLGAFASNSTPQNTPSIIEGLFPVNPDKKIKYVNWFMGFSENGTTVASKLPGSEVTQLLQKGYTPIITWEPMYTHLSRLDPAQPRLKDILSGKFDSYIDAFGDKLKSYNDTIIIRFMHEFEGDWYPWSLQQNNGDPNLYINSFRKVVDRVRARGASKVKWMWCVNGPTYHPVLAYNWIVGAYPGNAYVDIVACEAYNITIPGVPYWRSFRMGMAEPYYYLRKYFPQKPLFICENGCRERYSSENTSSQTKPQWIEQMDKELQTYFHEVRALVFFSISKTHDYRINSSSSSLSSVQTNIWNDNYYFAKKSTGTTAPTVSITSPLNNSTFSTPANITINVAASSSGSTISKVEFYQGSTKIGESSVSPFTFVWQAVPTGNYALKAIAIDKNGLTGTSATVNVIVGTCATPVVFASGPLKFCTGSVTLSVNHIPGNIYQWKKDGVNITGATGSSYTASQTGDYQVKVIQGSCIAWSSPVLVRVQSSLSASITPGGPTTFCSGGSVTLYGNTCSGFTYKWKRDGQYISGATGATYLATVSGSYQLQVTLGTSNAWSSQLVVTVNNCSPLEQDYKPIETAVGGRDSLNSLEMRVYPNPNSGLFTIGINMAAGQEEAIDLKIVNLMGEVVYERKFSEHGIYITEVVELDKSLPPGIYILRVTNGNQVENTNVILSK